MFGGEAAETVAAGSSNAISSTLVVVFMGTSVQNDLVSGYNIVTDSSETYNLGTDRKFYFSTIRMIIPSGARQIKLPQFS